MAEPTIDSTGNVGAGGAAAIPPLAGEGSKTPPTPGKGLGMGTDLGGSSTVAPKGLPGAPPKAPEVKTPEEQQVKVLTDRATTTLVNNLSKILDESSSMITEKTSTIKKAEASDKKIERLVNNLLDLGWTEKVLKSMIDRTKQTPLDFFKTLVEKIKSSGEAEAAEFLKSKMQPEDEAGLTTPPPVVPPLAPTPAGPAAPVGGPTPPPPPAFGKENVKASVADVHLTDKNQKMREATMKEKVIVTKEGTLEKVSDNSNEVLSRLVLAIRNTKSAMNAVEEEKLRYAGTIALKFAAEEDVKKEKDEGAEGGDKGLDLGGEFGDDDEEEDDFDDMDEDTGDVDKEKVLSGIQKLKDGIDEIEAAVKGVESDFDKPDMEMSAPDLGTTTSLLGTAEATINKAREVMKTAKADMKKLDEQKDKKKNKKKGKGGDAMSMTMGKSAASACEEKKKEDKKKEDKKEKKAGIESSDDLVQKVKARLAQFRVEKEANLYPFKERQGPVENLDKINVEGGNIKDIGSQPATDKDNPTINMKGVSYKDIPVKTEGTATPEKNVSMPGKKAASADAVQNVFDKARLSVELASQQQLRGLIDNPLKEAMVKNMVEAGVHEAAAKDIAHNAFLDGYEEAQKIIIKEAFETFMAKPYDDFVKVAKFTRDYVGREDVLASVPDEETRTKTASTAPLRGSSVTNGGDEYKNYWQDVNRNRRGF